MFRMLYRNALQVLSHFPVLSKSVVNSLTFLLFTALDYGQYTNIEYKAVLKLKLMLLMTGGWKKQDTCKITEYFLCLTHKIYWRQKSWIQEISQHCAMM